MTNKILENKKILVVGGAGFVGSNLVEELLKYSPKEILIIDNLLSSNSSNIPSDNCINFIFGSINEHTVLEKIPPDIDYVFHLACFHGNQSSIYNPIEDHKNNTFTTLNLFNKLSSFEKIKKVVYASAACAVAKKTYDKPKPTTEDDPISLYHDSPYSISKVIGEFYGNYFFIRHGLPIVKARFSNVYGPKEILGAGKWRGTVHSIWRNVIPTFIWRSIMGEPLYLDNNGEGIRDFIYVKDMARGLINCATKGEKGEVYNLASGKGTTIIELATLIKKLLNSSSEIILLPPRDWDRSGKRFACTMKSREKIDFEAKVTIEEGILETIEWTKRNQALIQRNINSHHIHLKDDEENLKFVKEK